MNPSAEIPAVPDRFDLTIGGRAASGRSTSSVINPATGQTFAEAPSCEKDQLDAALDAAGAVGPGWADDELSRREALEAAAERLARSVDVLAPVLTAEQGKPLAEARGEILGASALLRYHAQLPTPSEVIQDDADALIRVTRRPIGVVAAITPWNFPVFLAMRKLAPAWLAGNSVVLKPSPFTPLTTLALGRLLSDVLPAGVLSVVSGGDEVGEWMTSDPRVRKVSLTGSVATGRRVAVAAAPDLKRVTLELGGNDPAIVLDDADPADVAVSLFRAAFANNGQVCSAVKRVYAPEALAGSITDALGALAGAAKVGDGLDPETELGPLNNAPQLRRVSQLVDDAISNGARVVAGGQRIDREGYFFEPTILAGISDGERVVDEEQFGPVLPVIAYRDIDDAIRRANASHFGLDGSVWSADEERAAGVAAKLECGTAWVNVHGARGFDQPATGHKASGVGVENGPRGYEDYTELQVLYMARGVVPGTTG